ncbi:MAG: PAS domain-containing methyl-accepting chemotaxis protein [Firmicutes bacterium]|nr:PAS domain-containing methyl-accepting chemotaxis protein [Bacillota bacterium]
MLIGRHGRKERLAQSAYHRSVVESLPDPAFIVSPDLTITYFNRGCESLTGYSAGEVVGKMKCRQVLRADICETGCAIESCMLKKQAISGARVTITNRSGQRIPVSASASAILDANGEVIGGMEVIRDISDQVKAETDIRDKESLSSSIVEGLSDPFFMADENLTITYMNKACARLVGWEPEAVVGKKKCRDVFKSDICDSGCALKRCMSTGDTIAGARVTITHQSGRKIPILASAARIRNSKGEVVGGFELCRDISSLVEFDQQKKELERVAAEVSATSEEMAASSEEMSAATSQFANLIAEISQNAQKVAEVVERSVSLALEGTRSTSEVEEASKKIEAAVRDAEKNMVELSGKSDQIGAIVEIISGIADQTNLLALNAAIEAARAGEHGRGFAVVADEVRKLAAQAQNSTKEIGTLVKGINSNIERLNTSVGGVNREVSGSAQLTRQATRALGTMMDSFSEAKQGAQEMSGRIQEAAASAEELNASIGQVAGAAASLPKLAESVMTTAAGLGLGR